MHTMMVVVVVNVLAAGGAEARAKPRGWIEGIKGYLLAQKLLERCKGLKLTEQAHELGEDVEEPEFQDMTDASLSARKRGRTLEISYSSWGSGIDAGGLTAYWRVDLRRGCRYVGFENRCCSSRDPGGWRFTAAKRALPARKEQLQLLAQASYVPFDRNSPRFDAAAVQATGRCSDERPKRGWSLHGPIVAPRPQRPGLPIGSPAAIALEKLKQRKDEEVKGKLRSQTLTLTMGVGTPKRSRVQGRFEVFLSAARGRLGGQGVAVHDTKSKRSRWVLDTERCLTGEVTWLAGQGDLLVGSTFPVHPVFQETYGLCYFVLELGSGRAYKLRLAAGSSLSGDKKGRALVLTGPDKKTRALGLDALRARITRGGGR